MKTWASTPIVEKNKNVCKNEWIRIRQVIQKDLFGQILKIVRLLPEIFPGPFFAQMLQFEWECKRGWKSESERSKVPLKGESTIVENAPKSIIM